MEPQSTATKGWLARGLLRWIIRAISSLPVPVSPSMSTVASVGATARDHFVDLNHPAELPIISDSGRSSVSTSSLRSGSRHRGFGALSRSRPCVRARMAWRYSRRPRRGSPPSRFPWFRARHQDHRALGVMRPRGLENVQAVALVQIDVGDHHPENRPHAGARSPRGSKKPHPPRSLRTRGASRSSCAPPRVFHHQHSHQI